jgi:hypothetical protein
VVATNVAETSLTIPGIKYVIGTISIVITHVMVQGLIQCVCVCVCVCEQMLEGRKLVCTINSLERQR